MLKRGRPSSQPQSDVGKTHWIVDVVVVTGIAVSLGLIAVSALLNFRMGYRSADTDFDGMVYGLGAGLGDALKAIAPFMISYGVINRDVIAVVSAAVIFVVFTGYSFTAAIGFAAEHRANKAAGTTTAIDNRRDTRKELDRAVARLDQLGAVRSSEEVDASISEALKVQVGPRNRSVDEISNGCTLNRQATRAHCATIAGLKTERARSEEAEGLKTAVEKYRGELKTQSGEGARQSADAQVETLRKLGQVARPGLTDADVDMILATLLALFIELGSGLGLYVATTPWRARKTTVRAATYKDTPMRPGRIETFVLEQVEMDDRAEVKAAELYDHYVVWCRKLNALPYGRTDFNARFRVMATDAGIRTVIRNRTEVYQQVRLLT